MPTIRLADSQKPGIPQVKRLILMFIRQGITDQADLQARLLAMPMIRPAVLAAAYAELQSEGKIEVT